MTEPTKALEIVVGGLAVGQVQLQSCPLHNGWSFLDGFGQVLPKQPKIMHIFHTQAASLHSLEC